MAYVNIVTTRDDLKRAVKNKAQYINIKNAEVAKHVSVMKTASKAVITAALIGAGVTATMFWNPIGWIGGISTAVASGVVAAAVSHLVLTLGIESFWSLYGDYEIIGRRIAKLDDSTVVEGELIICIK